MSPLIKGSAGGQWKLLVIAGIFVILFTILGVSEFIDRPTPGQQVTMVPRKKEKGMKTETTADSRLYFDRSTLSAQAGDTITVSAMIDPGVNRVSGAELEVNYDPKKLKLEKITPSGIFSLELAKAKIDQLKGLGSIALGIPLENPSIAEPAAIATYTFRVLQSTGNAMAAFSGNTIVAADHEPGNVVKEKETAVITVGSAE